MSLPETCLTLAIASTVAMIAVPSLSKTRDEYALTSAARDVASRMHSARIRSISRNVACRFRVASPDAYVVECYDPVWTIVETVAMPRGISISANARPQFHPLGNVAPTATVTLSNSSRQKRVIVNNAGRVRMQ
jgi:Tfp pilus assembly protein FimT